VIGVAIEVLAAPDGPIADPLAKTMGPAVRAASDHRLSLPDGAGTWRKAQLRSRSGWTG
jgi:hypothetical protein